MRAVLARVRALGGVVAVGCAEGADRLVAREALALGLPVFVACAWPRERALRWVLAAEGRGASVRFGCGGPVAAGAGRVLARRTAWLVRSVARRPGSWLVALPGGRGTALACRVASSLGLSVWRAEVTMARKKAEAVRREAGMTEVPDGFEYVGPVTPELHQPDLWRGTSAWAVKRECCEPGEALLKMSRQRQPFIELAA